jgi:hypothetical protein
MPTVDDQIRRSMHEAAEQIAPSLDIDRRLAAAERRGARSRSLRYARNATVGLVVVLALTTLGPGLIQDLRRIGHTADPSPAPTSVDGTFVVNIPDGGRAAAAGMTGTWTIALSDGGITLVPPSTFASAPLYADYTIEGDTMTTSVFRGSLCDSTGTYRWTRSASELRLEVLSDPCAGRVALLTAGLATRRPTAVDRFWEAQVITRQASAEAIAEAGYPPRFADAFVNDLGFDREIRYSILFADGLFTAYASTDGGASQGIDRGAYEVRGDRLIIRPFSGGSTTFRFQVAPDPESPRDVLALHLLEDTQPDYQGIPNEVFVTGIYLSASFTSPAAG